MVGHFFSSSCVRVGQEYDRFRGRFRGIWRLKKSYLSIWFKANDVIDELSDIQHWVDHGRQWAGPPVFRVGHFREGHVTLMCSQVINWEGVNRWTEEAEDE